MDSEKKKFEDIRKPLEEKGYETLKSIGKGAFGEVLLAKNSNFSFKEENDEHLCAVKIISKTHIKKKPYLQKYIDQEIQIMKNLNHPNIVRHEQSFSSIVSVYIF
jgi:serine/threonine protein kinase